MRRLLEEVTCDRCGMLFRFEKLANDTRIRVRIESLSDWLCQSGWRVVGAWSHFRPTDICPICRQIEENSVKKGKRK